MKKYILPFLALSCCIVACTNKEEAKTSDTTASVASTIKLPYTASYTTEFNNNVSDSDLLVVLNSYKYWENNDMKALRATMGDSMSASMPTGLKFNGKADSIMSIWGKYRDSLSSVSIDMQVWLKNHSIKDSTNYINVWYKEIDTFKSGKADSAYYEDDNVVKNGKIVWLSSHKQVMK
jgi:hypothetical protein